MRIGRILTVAGSYVAGICGAQWPVRAAFVAGSWPGHHEPVQVVDDRSPMADPCSTVRREELIADVDPARSCRLGCAAAVGTAHGAVRHPARLRARSAPLAWHDAGQSLGRVRRGRRRNGDPAEQHRHRADGGGLCRRRGRGAGARAGGDARRQCRHHADRAGAVVRRGGSRARLDPAGRDPVSPRHGGADARYRACGDRAWPGADGTAPAGHAHDTL